MLQWMRHKVSSTHPRSPITADLAKGGFTVGSNKKKGKKKNRQTIMDAGLVNTFYIGGHSIAYGNYGTSFNPSGIDTNNLPPSLSIYELPIALPSNIGTSYLPSSHPPPPTSTTTTPPCLTTPYYPSLIAGTCHACNTRQPRRPWTVGPCPPCHKCGHKFCGKCEVLLYQSYRRCWACDNETEIASSGSLSYGLRAAAAAAAIKCRKCGFKVDASCPLVWREEKRIGRSRLIYKGKEVNL